MAVIRKAVITCGGYATRFLPITKAIPKEMLPLGDKPVIHYILQELEDAGITQVLILIGRGREILQNYIDKNYEIDDQLEKRRNITKTNFFNKLNIFYRRVPMPKGVADCVSYSKDFCDNEPFILSYCDDVFFEINPTKELLNDYNKNKLSCIITKIVPAEIAHNYGVVQLQNDFVTEITEKPKNPKSSLVAVGRYLLTPEIFDMINADSGDIPDQLNKFAKRRKLRAIVTNAKRCDTGNLAGYYEAFQYVMEKLYFMIP
jgi:UTP--glucose-1-phosphate uridylyltransferase